MNIIAEIGNAHNGDLREAIAYIRACAAAGVWGVKFQLHHPSEPDRGWNRVGRPIYHPQDKTRADYWKRIAFTLDQWTLLAEEAAKCCVNFGVSIFQPDIWEYIDIRHLLDFIKTPYGCRIPLKSTIPDNVPWIASVGLHKTDACDEASVHLLCLEGYPTITKIYAPNLVDDGYDGLSSHWPTTSVLDAAAKQGCHYIEVHVTWSRQQLHPDACCSLTVEELTKWIQSQ